jgi:hypothetical protein
VIFAVFNHKANRGKITKMLVIREVSFFFSPKKKTHEQVTRSFVILVLVWLLRQKTQKSRHFQNKGDKQLKLRFLQRES